jgi:cob(I)alamin adenosyltransferase
MEIFLPPLKQFILPGGVPSAATAHLARSVCRRAERAVAELAQGESVSQPVLIYLNRLSDFLFVLARYLNHQAGGSEINWKRESP